MESQESAPVNASPQDDLFTRRARPAIVYVGLLFIGFVYVVYPMLSGWLLLSRGEYLTAMPPLSLPPEFWWSWASVSGIWVAGRTWEKRGAINSVVSAITGALK